MPHSSTWPMPAQNSVCPSQTGNKLLKPNPQCPSTYPSETAQETAPFKTGAGEGRGCSDSIHRNTTQQLLSSTLKVAFSMNELTSFLNCQRRSTGELGRILVRDLGFDLVSFSLVLKHKAITSSPGCPCTSLRNMLPRNKPLNSSSSSLYLYPVCTGAFACVSVCELCSSYAHEDQRRGHCIPGV